MITRQFTITSDVGLHARPATILVQKASQFKSEIELEYNSEKVNAKSIMGIMTLGIAQNADFSLHFNGEDEVEAAANIEELFKVEGIAK